MAAAGTMALAAGATAQTDLVIDLAQLGTVHPGFRIEGVRAGDNLGVAVSGAGDVNGDGLADLVLGADEADPGGDSGAGESYVVFGRKSNSAVALGSLGNGGFRISGIDAFDRSGRSVSGAGDVNGDAHADLLVGAHGASPGEKLLAGESYVVFGKATNSTVNLGALVSGGFRVDGAAAEDYSGWSVSGAGDIDGDGLSDVFMGGWRAIRDGRHSIGASHMVFGKATGTAVDLGTPGTGSIQIKGANEFDESGWSVSGAGDVNGDGVPDLLVGSPEANSGDEYSAGASYVLFGGASSAVVDLDALGADGFRIEGARANDSAGWSVAGAGDVNGDGFADLVVGAYRADPGGDLRAGESYVVFGKSGSSTVHLGAIGAQGFRIVGIDQYDFSGASVSGAGDVNGDGLADLVVGASGADSPGESRVGESYVVFGKADEVAVNLDALGVGGFRIDGVGADDRSGYSVSGAGDVNGDGLADLIVGALGADPGGASNAGESYVVFAPTTPPATATYRTHARSGDAPRIAVGICGDGSDDDSPSSRCWIDFDGGFGPGNKQSSLQTVTLTRNDAGIRVLKRDRLANVQWRVQTNRIGHRKTRLTFKYTDAEIAGLREDTLRVWQASSPSGPWYRHGDTIREPQRNRVTIVVPRLGYFAIEGEPASQ